MNSGAALDLVKTQVYCEVTKMSLRRTGFGTICRQRAAVPRQSTALDSRQLKHVYLTISLNAWFTSP
jgi:hypothetical protein